MNKINIGKVIQTHRKNKNLTQEDLADYLSVSKAAVSKWELQQSHPDITMLPLLANFFGITIDELLDYEPQLTKKQIQKLYERLSNSISESNFEDIFKECEQCIKNYYSCWELQARIAQLYLNNYTLSENKNFILENILEKCNLVSENSNDNALVREVIGIKAICYLILNKPLEVINLLEDLIKTPESFELLLSSAYSSIGDFKKSEYLLQKLIYINVIESLQAFSQIILKYKDNPKKLNDYFDKAISLSKLFNIDKIHPTIVISIYLTSANMYVLIKQPLLAIKSIENAINLIKEISKTNIELKSDNFFDLIEDYFNELTLGKTPPLSKNKILTNLKESILQNPTFEILKQEPKYKDMLKTIKNL